MTDTEPAAKKPKLEEQDEGSCHVTPMEEDSSVDEACFLMEKDAGIEEYISQLPGFHAVLKQRFSDFIVNEIDMTGQVVHLTNKEYVPELKPKPAEVPGESEKSETSISESQQQAIKDGMFTESDLEKLQTLVQSKDKNHHVILQTEGLDDKEMRTKVHNSIRNCFDGLESSTTESEEGKKVIRVTKASGGRSGRNRYPNNWPADRGDYCRFVMYKSAKDTMNAMWVLAKNLRVNRALFQYAGTKDRRAKTTQEVTAFRITAERLSALNKCLRDIVLGNFRYVNKHLQLGNLKGNKFVIVLRNVKGDDDVINKAMTSLKDIGFINYYGMQRFGTSTIPTHHIGRALLQSNYKEAVDLVLKPRPGENELVSDCRKMWMETRNAKDVLAKLPRRFTIETVLLEGLVKEGEKNYCNAFLKIPRNTRLMYVHSYQSYIWNKAVSRRIKEYGLKPIVGDLVLPKESDTDLLENFEEEVEESDRFPKSNVPVIVVDEDSVSKFTIHDVVMPLPGYSVRYPENEVGSWYAAMLAEDELASEALRHKNKQFALPGAYRKMIIHPEDVAWQTYYYNDVTHNLALSDLDRLENAPEPQSEISGEYKALKIEMSLPPSCYATMAIREILKSDTSSAYQSKLNHPKPTETDTTEIDSTQNESDKT